MKRAFPFAACIAGIAVVILLLPRFNVTQPSGIRLTRGDAIPIADAEAARIGIPVDKSWAILTWAGSPLLEKEFANKPDLRRRANDDAVLGPRLGGYKRTYYRHGVSKFSPYGSVVVDEETGKVLMARVQHLDEELGGRLTESQLRPRADAFVRSHQIPGAPSPQFESAKANPLRSRTDWTFRYRVPSNFPAGNVVPYLYVYFAGDQFAGWGLIEEYADGRMYSGESDVISVLTRLSTYYILGLILLIIFLKKYHAGEVGIETGSMLFAACVVISLLIDYLVGPSATEGTGLGSLDARTTAAADMAFKFLLFDIPLAVVVFFAWSVGESYARERWGERLASFDSILRRDFFNATVGRSVLNGILLSPAVAAASFAAALIPLALGTAHVDEGFGTDCLVIFGGPALLLLFALLDAIAFPVIFMFLLAWSNSRRVAIVGATAAVVVGSICGVCVAPITPGLQRLLFGFGGTVALILLFRVYDVLATAFALFGASIIGAAAPLLSVARGHELTNVATILGVPVLAALVLAVVALLTRREVVYTYEDLAPHVKRIVERERVKAEIDAANRIQAALLPLDAPTLSGASVSSHYRAATEIGGDYFDFLVQPEGHVGIAFGDVSGHGLTSGIVMAMAKSALLVQVGYDPSPAQVLTVLNDVVMKTAPKRILMTFFFGLLDPRSQTLRFSSAGHLDPYVYRATTKRLEALSSWGFPLGVRRREPFREHAVEFAAGDRLILYSDGLIEALDDDGEPFGFERFERTIVEHGEATAEEIKKAVLASIRKFTRNRPPEDDQTLVVVSFDEPAAAYVPERAYASAAVETVN